MNIPTNLKYTKSDEWVKVDGNVATIGISDYAQEQLSDIVYVEIPVEVGEHLLRNAICATLESVKAAADVNLPVSGAITEINEKLPQTPEVVNSDPFGAGWMLKLSLDNLKEMNDLMDAVAYQKYCEERSH
ncbi:MAG TPA: glycine cleavage system protein GcvH [Anaerolineaceae bacterium]|nr:glycine cleavage system protein GcvH [Anaerolineaceae bacterium]